MQERSEGIKLDSCNLLRAFGRNNGNCARYALCISGHARLRPLKRSTRRESSYETIKPAVVSETKRAHGPYRKFRRDRDCSAAVILTLTCESRHHCKMLKKLNMYARELFDFARETATISLLVHFLPYSRPILFHPLHSSPFFELKTFTVSGTVKTSLTY